MQGWEMAQQRKKQRKEVVGLGSAFPLKSLLLNTPKSDSSFD